MINLELRNDVQARLVKQLLMEQQEKVETALKYAESQNVRSNIEYLKNYKENLDQLLEQLQFVR